MPFLVAIGAWLKSRLGAFLFSIVLWCAERAVRFVIAVIQNWLYWRERRAKQKEAEKKVEQDVEQGKPRDDQTRKNEEEWLNQ